MRRPIFGTALTLFTVALSLLACRDSSRSDEPAGAATTTGSANTPGEGAASPGTPPSPISAGSSVAPGDVPPSEKVTVETKTLTVEGTPRSYVLVVPKTLPQNVRLPLVLALHGDGGDGPGMRQMFPLDAVTGEAAVVAYPTGENNVWATYVAPAVNNDMKFIKALVADLESTLPIDPARRFGTGFSAGAYFLNQMACYENGYFRGVVAHAGGAPSFFPGSPEEQRWPENNYAKCPGQERAPIGGLAVLSIHGDLDAPGGEFVATYWASLNGCEYEREATTPSPCARHKSCPADRPAVFCGIPGLGHALWDRATVETWSFLQGL